MTAGQLFSGVGSSTFNTDIAAQRSMLLIFRHADAKNTPTLRTEEPCAPKVRQTFFFFTDQTAIFLLMFQKKNGGLEAASLRAHPQQACPPYSLVIPSSARIASSRARICAFWGPSSRWS